MQVGEQLPFPEGSNLEDDVKELWRGDAAWQPGSHSFAHWHTGTHTEAAPGAPPGLDPYAQKLQTVNAQLSHLRIDSPLQVLKQGTYFYKDPQGQIHVRCLPADCQASCGASFFTVHDLCHGGNDTLCCGTVLARSSSGSTEYVCRVLSQLKT